MLKAIPQKLEPKMFLVYGRLQLCEATGYAHIDDFGNEHAEYMDRFGFMHYA